MPKGKASKVKKIL